MRELFLGKLRLLVCLAVVVFISGCATTGTYDERDPLEGFNRGVYSFNQGMDKVLFDPLSKLYQAITPDILDKGITNFFSNLNEISVVANDILQFKFAQAYLDTARFLFNSTLGLLGFFDVSSTMGLAKHNEDFGQTLAHWGVGSGPFLMAPFLGPTTLRHATGFFVDQGVLSPVFYLENDELRAGLYTLEYVDIKTDLLSAKDLLGDAALDEYEFIKNAYFSKRESLINDGALPVLYE
jgi:phospholipid-binding lipoprotein MlaA